jgi:hydroxymethylglutaryl-CoA synthase
MGSIDTGVAALGLKLPDEAIDLRVLAEIRGVDPDKYTIGLGCDRMAVAPSEAVVDLAVGAAERALSRWGGDPSRIGLLAVGTETALDMSRPLSAFVAERIGLQGAIRSYEVKHACYGGTLALRQAVEWRQSGAAASQAALVIAADVARYAPEHPGEPTGGAGAVAFVVDAPRVCRVDLETFAYSEPAFDFWRPVGEAYPRVDGKLSLDCYKRAAVACFDAWGGDRLRADALAGLRALCFHAPFPKMVKKAVRAIGEAWGLPGEAVDAIWRDQVEPGLEWNQQMGNAYTASLWFSVAKALAGAAAGERVTAFSYGSGFGAELFALEAGPAAAEAAWVEDIEADLASRTELDAAAYLQRISSAASTTVSSSAG